MNAPLSMSVVLLASMAATPTPPLVDTDLGTGRKPPPVDAPPKTPATDAPPDPPPADVPPRAPAVDPQQPPVANEPGECGVLLVEGESALVVQANEFRRTVLPDSVVRGARVQFSVAGLSTAKNAAPLQRAEFVLVDDEHTHTAVGDLKNWIVDFPLPSDAHAGRYLVCLKASPSQVLAMPGELRVAEDAQARPVISRIQTPAYPLDERNSFKIEGDHLGDDVNTVVDLHDHDPIRHMTDCNSRSAKACLVVSEHRITVHGVERMTDEGPTKLAVRVGTLRSDEKELTLCMFSTGTIRTFAISATLLVAGLVLWLVRSGFRRYRVGRQRYRLTSLFIIDRETQSYSLSKLQLLMWTCAVVFAYVYLVLCRAFIHWDTRLPDIPAGVAPLLGMSLGTAVLSAGVTVARGPKGAGPQFPSAADFISAGGEVIAERLQFFVWTLVGVAGFVMGVLVADPANLSDLPEVPTNFLSLMGISSVGYLAGKSVRPSGPLFTKVRAEKVAVAGGSEVKLIADGKNLESDGRVRINSVDLVAKVGDSKAAQEGGKSYTHLEWTLPMTPECGVPFEFELVNADGQYARVELTVLPFAIRSTEPLTASTTEAPLNVAVVNATDGPPEATWQPPGEEAAPVPTTKITRQGDRVSVCVTPGTVPGKGKISLIDASGQSATFPVDIVPPSEAANA
jgi:hypothetical protein